MTSLTDLIFLRPVLKDTIWGGSRLKDEFHYQGATDHTGECWGISAHPHGDCTIENGPFKGTHLSELYHTHRELFGGAASEAASNFPLLVKYIDAREDLSIQVHPDDSYARTHEGADAVGKAECWLVLDAEPGANIIIGTKARTHDEARELIEQHRYKDLVREIPVFPGDFFQIEPGTLHAIKAGTLILETQQSSDITYRVYDYDRVQNGKPRRLDVQQSIDSINPDNGKNSNYAPTVHKKDCGTITEYIHHKAFSLYRLQLRGDFTHTFTSPYANVSVLSSTGALNGTQLVKGQHFIIPSGYGECHFTGDMDIVVSTPGEEAEKW